MKTINIFNQKQIRLFLNGNRTVNTIILIISILFAHYVGFLSQVPLQILAASGSNLVFGITTTFLFYIAFSAILARILVLAIYPLLLPFFIADIHLRHTFKLQNLSQKKKFVQNYNNILKNENLALIVLQLILFLTILPSIYLDPIPSWKTILPLVTIFLLIVISGLFRAKFLLLFSIKKYINRIKKYSYEKINALSATLLTIAMALVILSFIMGKMRIEMLINSQPQQITNQYYRGYANFLASSDSSTLLFEKKNGKMRYIYVTDNYALAVESEPKSFPLLGLQTVASNKTN